MTEPLTKQNAMEYAWKSYKNPQMFHGDEFMDDWKSFFYVKKLITRHANGSEVNHHLTLNHIITLVNLFGGQATTNLLRLYVAPKQHVYLNAFLFFLNLIPPSDSHDEIDPKIYQFLQNI